MADAPRKKPHGARATPTRFLGAPTNMFHDKVVLEIIVRLMGPRSDVLSLACVDKGVAKVFGQKLPYIRDVAAVAGADGRLLELQRSSLTVDMGALAALGGDDDDEWVIKDEADHYLMKRAWLPVSGLDSPQLGTVVGYAWTDKGDNGRPHAFGCRHKILFIFIFKRDHLLRGAITP